MNASLSEAEVRSVLRTRALRVFAVYAVSFLFGGTHAFFLGLKCIMIPIRGWEGPNHSHGDEIVAATVGLAWLANPLIWGGMVALARGSKSWALMLGTSAMLFALIASWVAVSTVVFLGCYALWIASMGLLLYLAGQPVPLPGKTPVGHRTILTKLAPPALPNLQSEVFGRKCRRSAKVALLAYLPVLLISVVAGFGSYPLLQIDLYAVHVVLWGAMILLARGSSRLASMTAAAAMGICLIFDGGYLSKIGLLGIGGLIIWSAQRAKLRDLSDSASIAQAPKLDVERLLKHYDDLE